MIELAAMCEALGAALRVDGDGLRDAPHPGGVHRAARDVTSPTSRRTSRSSSRSSTSSPRSRREVGIGGDMRTSICAVERDGDGASSSTRTLDHLLRRAGRRPPRHRRAARRTRRRTIRSSCSCARRTTRSTQKGAWDTLGMRGTCSPPVQADSPRARTGQIFERRSPTSRARRWSRSPTSSGRPCWLGIATAAVRRARAFVRSRRARSPARSPPTALRLAEVVEHAPDDAHQRARRRERVRRADAGPKRGHGRALVDRVRAQDEQPQGARRRRWSSRSSTTRS